MASPQVENGHIKIASEIFDAFCRIRIPGEAMQILNCILRKTYGWHKKQDSISLSQFVEMTGINKQCVIRALNKLTDMNLIVIEKDTPPVPKKITLTSTYRFNKDYESWKPLSKKITLSKKIKPPVPKKIHTKATNTKANKNFLSDSIEIRLSEYLFKHILRNNPNAKQPNLQIWAKQIDFMIRIDHRNPDEIREVIKWCQSDTFWMTNILSTKKLHDKYDQLILKKNHIKPVADNKNYSRIITAGDNSIFADPER